MELDMVLAPSKNACVVIFENKVAGSIVSHLVQLINCINAGHRFLARIRSIDGSKCVVMVLHESLI
jgi:hypothetical protein